MPIDLYAGWPRARRSDDQIKIDAAAERVLDGQRSTDLYSLEFSESNRRAGQRRLKSDPSRITQILSRLVTSIAGVPLSQIVPVAPGIPGIIGADLRGSEFNEFLGQFLDALTDLGFRPRVPVLPANSAARGDVRRQLAARALGCSASTADNVGAPPSRYARRFDDLSSALSDGRTVSAVLGSGFDGLPPGSFEVVSAMITAIQNSLRSGDEAGARQAGTDAGILVAALHSVFGGGTTTQRTTRASGSPMVEISPGHFVDFELAERGPDGQPRLKADAVTSRKSERGKVTSIQVGGQDVPVDRVDLSTGVPRCRGSHD